MIAIRAKRCLFAAIAAASLTCIAAPAIAQTAVVHVDINNGVLNPSDHGQNGWGGDAYKYLQDALIAADALLVEPHNFEEVHIWVAAAIDGNGDPIPYKPDQGSGYTTGDKTASFVLRNNVSILGSFPPDPHTHPTNERDPALWAKWTVLSGDLDDDDDWAVTYDLQTKLPIITVSATAIDDNSYHVVFAEEVDDTAILDGFTIRGGNADYQNSSGVGGGVHLLGSECVIRNCIIRFNFSLPKAVQENTCSKPGGGGVYIGPAGENGVIRGRPRFEKCTIVHNVVVAGDGGGVTQPIRVRAGRSGARAGR